LEAAPSDLPYAWPRSKLHFWGRRRYAGTDVRAVSESFNFGGDRDTVGHIWVVSRVLDDRCSGTVAVQHFNPLNIQRHRFTVRKPNVDGFATLADKCAGRRPGGRGSTSARRHSSA
jgi:hypothetical protein